MTTPYFAYAEPTPAKPTSATEQIHEVTPPPEDTQLVRDIAVILASGLALYAMAEAIEALLKPYKIGLQAIMAALGLAGRGTAATPRTPLARFGLLPTDRTADLVRNVARSDLYFRAAYVLNAAHRIEERVQAGETIGVAVSHEAANYRAHEEARRARLATAARVARAAEVHGDLLGWYLNPMLNNEIECLTANGHNFRASEGTLIGYPGSVHPRCGCIPGPPIEGAGMVNDAVAPILRRVPASKVLKLRPVRAKAS